MTGVQTCALPIYKERKFGRGCLANWKAQQKELLAQFGERLVPFEEMLMYRPFLLGDQPRFVDFDLCGILGNFLYSGRYRLPAKHTRLKGWYDRMTRIKFTREEELHS